MTALAEVVTPPANSFLYHFLFCCTSIFTCFFYITNKYVRALQQSLYSVYVEIKTALTEVVTPPANSFL
jgi:Na+-driven multidrug efflux pump